MVIRNSILERTHGLSPFELWLLSVLIFTLVSGAVVLGMELLLKGWVTYDHLLTDIIVALLIAFAVVALLIPLIDQLKQQTQHGLQLTHELSESERRAKQAISASRLVSWDYDLTTGKIHLSESWSQLLGGKPTPTSATINELAELVPGKDLPSVRKSLVDALKGHHSSAYQIEHRVKKLNGELVWILSEGAVVERDQHGRALRMTGTNRNITERKKLEKEILDRRNEMESLQISYVAAQTASAIAHELNQPLLAIASYSEAALILLQNGKPDFDKIVKAIEGSKRQAHRAGKSIRELLEFLSLKEFPTESFDINGEILGVLDSARLEYELQFQSNFNLEEGLPLVQANRIHVQKILFNLLNNGIEAMQAAGVSLPAIIVAVRTVKDEGVVQITITDNGPGLRKEDIHRLFEPFFTTKSSGIGMGLTVSRALIEANGGQLWVDPHESPGATFHLTLPFAI